MAAKGQTAERVALYARISEDRQDGAGVERQLKDLRALAKARGWKVVAELPENSISAYSGAKRPKYAELLTLVDDGLVDRVAVWHLSRLWRNRSERVRDMQRFQTARVAVSAVRGPELDFASATGRMIANVISEFDSYESDLKAERVAAASDQRAREGRANGAVPYGYRKVAGAKEGVLEPDPVEGPEVVAMVEAVIAGRSLREICADLNRRGVPTPRQSSLWRPSTVVKTIRRPAIAGLRQHRGEVIGKAQWTALVKKARWEKACSMLADPERKTNTGNESERKHLLSYSVGSCGVCGSVLRVVTRQGKYGKPQTLYTCEAKGCTGRNRDNVDALVRDVVLAYLDSPKAAEATRTKARRGRRDPEADPVVLRARLDEAADAYAEGLIDMGMLRKIRDQITPRLAALEAEKPEPSRPVDTRALTRLRTSADREKAWDAMTIADQHAVVRALFDRVVIAPTTRRGPGFDPESVLFEWRAA